VFEVVVDCRSAAFVSGEWQSQQVFAEGGRLNRTLFHVSWEGMTEHDFSEKSRQRGVATFATEAAAGHQSVGSNPETSPSFLFENKECKSTVIELNELLQKRSLRSQASAHRLQFLTNSWRCG
jgi:hypothetical protein